MALTARLPSARQLGGLLAGWRGLRRFWAAVLLLFVIGVGVLQLLGPPMPHVDPRFHTGSPDAGTTGHAFSGAKVTDMPRYAGGSVARSTLHALRPGRDVPGPIAAPDPALLEPYPGEADLKLPRIGVGGRGPMAVYAAGFDSSNLRPRVGMLIAGIGMSQADSMAAIKDLPGGVTLAISPYAGDISHLLDVARITEHEYLLSIPMEPQGYPVNDPDDRRALMTSLPVAENLDRLRWVLSRLSGYVGVTNALGTMRGERLSAIPDQFTSVLEEVAQRGLLFADARTDQPVLPYVWNRSVDVVIDDDPVNVSSLDQHLDQLSRAALDKGSALGLVWLPRPVTLARVAAWTTTLTAKGLALAPVSALALAPAKQEADK